MLNTELNRALDHVQSKNSYAYRLKNAGVDICQSRIAKQLFSYDEPVYIVKRDISQYYPSVDKEILLEILRRFIDPDDYLYKLLRSRIYYPAMEGDVPAYGEPGIPFGAPISCFLANFYLLDLDAAIEKFPVHYFRYADDILIFSNNKANICGAREVLDESRCLN